MRQHAARGAVILLLLMCVCAGCGSGRSDRDARPSTTTAMPTRPPLLCDLVTIPLESMEADGTTFLEVVEDQTGEGADQAISAMIGLGLMARGAEAAGRFEPVLRYLAERSAASLDQEDDPPPKLTEAIRENARELDAELARGRCD